MVVVVVDVDVVVDVLDVVTGSTVVVDCWMVVSTGVPFWFSD
jgi:hypothetical protein